MSENNEIISTAALDESDGREPDGRESDLVATHEPENKGIEFHVSMRDYTLQDMENLIVEAGARMLVGRHSDSAMAKAIEARAITLIAEKADKALAGVTAEIIDQPMTPQFAWLKGDKAPVTMREFIGLTGREYLTARVDSSGKATTDSYHAKPRIQYLVDDFMSRAFKTEIEKATNAAVAEIRAAIKAQHDAFLAAEKARLKDALAHTLGDKS